MPGPAYRAEHDQQQPKWKTACDPRKPDGHWSSDSTRGFLFNPSDFPKPRALRFRSKCRIRPGCVGGTRPEAADEWGLQAPGPRWVFLEVLESGNTVSSKETGERVAGGLAAGRVRRYLHGWDAAFLGVERAPSARLTGGPA
ncbi:PREDICTED: uncharacterized protein LOC105513897 [Colobus angolensis palliatus]|uniref:uncharacterized protein LOC105513897 n=1 Tax=Colobus angolensis palliatus TaxID=336983 RepID=UPI0005F3755F|nr:PREDICTED: uncharacterized protein LOC105513897 [Colobus angolensis palliatus]